MGFSRQEYWSGLPCPPPGDLPNPGIEPTFLMSSALAGGFLTTSATWEAHMIIFHKYKSIITNKNKFLAVEIIDILRESLGVINFISPEAFKVTCIGFICKLFGSFSK